MRMIELTRVNEFPCWVNAYAIAAIEPHREGSHVYTVGGGSFAVKEAPEIILRQLPEPT